jgi:D-alanyl-D-alanine carboxypeptidase (penicillin-binding protein 5/6)
MNRQLLSLSLCALLWTGTSAAPVFAEDAAPGFATKAKQIYLVESKTGTVLLATNENQSFPPASLAKLMTMELVFSALKNNDITLDTAYPVSEFAWRSGGAPSGTTTMFAALRSQIRVEDLIRGVVVQNGNDACIVLAEGLSHTEAEFAARMTARAKDLGLSRSSFGNATGLPSAESRTTVRDMVELARHIYRDFPQFYPIYAQPDFLWNKITQRNKNPLLSLGIGVDGLGAGFAEGSGYAVVASVERNKTRLFLAMGGLASDKDRLDEARRVRDKGSVSDRRSNRGGRGLWRSGPSCRRCRQGSSRHLRADQQCRPPVRQDRVPLAAPSPGGAGAGCGRAADLGGRPGRA